MKDNFEQGGIVIAETAGRRHATLEQWSGVDTERGNSKGNAGVSGGNMGGAAILCTLFNAGAVAHGLTVKC